MLAPVPTETPVVWIDPDNVSAVQQVNQDTHVTGSGGVTVLPNTVAKDVAATLNGAHRAHWPELIARTIREGLGAHFVDPKVIDAIGAKLLAAL